MPETLPREGAGSEEGGEGVMREGLPGAEDEGVGEEVREEGAGGEGEGAEEGKVVYWS